ATELTGMIAEYGFDKLKDTIAATFEELQSLKPVLAKSGFTMGEIDLVLSIPPGFEVSIVQSGAGAAGLAEIESTMELTKMQSMVVSSLKNAYALDGVFKKYSYTIRGISIMVSIPPKVHVHLHPVSAEEQHLLGTGDKVEDVNVVKQLTGE